MEQKYNIYVFSFEILLYLMFVRVVFIFINKIKNKALDLIIPIISILLLGNNILFENFLMSLVNSNFMFEVMESNFYYYKLITLKVVLFIVYIYVFLKEINRQKSNSNHL